MSVSVSHWKCIPLIFPIKLFYSKVKIKGITFVKKKLNLFLRNNKRTHYHIEFFLSLISLQWLGGTWQSWNKYLEYYHNVRTVTSSCFYITSVFLKSSITYIDKCETNAWIGGIHTGHVQSNPELSLLAQY